MSRLILRRARVENAAAPRDLLIEDGVVRTVGTVPDTEVGESIDCAGRIVLPGFVEPHLHLDKALLDAVRPNPDGTLAGAIAVTGELKRAFTHTDVRDRARTVLETAIRNGTTLIRAHPDVDPVAGLLGVEVLIELREKYRQLVDLQIVAFPQEGIFRSPGTEKLLTAAITAGADVVGGCPYNEDSLADAHRHVELVLDLAAEHGLPADLHADFADDASDPRYALAEFIAEQTARRGLSGRVAIGHATSLAGRPPADRARALAALAEAGVAVVPLPATDLHLGGRHDTTATRRGIAPVRELWAAGVLAACSSNNIRNAFTPYGSADALDTALLLAQTGHLSGPTDLARVLRMITYDAARVTGTADDYGIRPGARADLVVLDSTTYDDIVLDRPDRAYVIKAGRVVARTTRTTELLAP
ncbi:amidohydrolase family protein [Streptomyces sp. SID8379]|uniref:amidohydrolase family protein n=1 Tax=unclassified Streptomyces TaxID=2593676 RepID=UPI0003769FBB|nr:amidohydrolase family protein [Streptomyces sp. HmicA12]MYW64975.1 amidohydrolase family protein [Streptomyces sp. SID8379]